MRLRGKRPQISQPPLLDHMSFRPGGIIWGRDESSQVSSAQIASPQNHESLNNCCFKLLDLGVVCYAAKVTDMRCCLHHRGKHCQSQWSRTLELDLVLFGLVQTKRPEKQKRTKGEVHGGRKRPSRVWEVDRGIFQMNRAPFCHKCLQTVGLMV